LDLFARLYKDAGKHNIKLHKEYCNCLDSRKWW